MGDRVRLGIGVGASLVLHGALFATAPAWANAEAEERSTGPEAPAIEVVALDPAVVREILEPRVRPAAACPVEAPSGHPPPDARPWPALAVPRPAEPPAPTSSRTLLPVSLEARTITRPPTVDLLRSVAPVPAVDVTPEPAPTPASAPVSTAAEPPALVDLRGLVIHREPLSYPATAERRGLEGIASIAVEVGEDGTVVSTRVLRSSGHRVLDRAARRNLERWRFDPSAVRAAGRGRVFRQDVQFQIK